MTTTEQTTSETLRAEVAIVGAGPAGLAAAVALGRSLRSVVVVDDATPRNAASASAHNVLGREGASPAALAAAGRAEADAVGVRFVAGTTADASRVGERLRVDLADGRAVEADRLLLATGLTDHLPDIPGVAEHWGTAALHCPYCHGWEVRGTRIAVLATSPHAGHQATLFARFARELVVVEHEPGILPAEARATLAALGAELVTGPVSAVDGDGEHVRAVVLADGRSIAADAVTVQPRFEARAELFTALGGELEDTPFGSFVPTGQGGTTAVPGVWAAGNIADLGAVIAASAAAGVLAGAGINGELALLEAERAVAAAG